MIIIITNASIKQYVYGRIEYLKNNNNNSINYAYSAIFLLYFYFLLVIIYTYLLVICTLFSVYLYITI